MAMVSRDQAHVGHGDHGHVGHSDQGHDSSGHCGPESTPVAVGALISVDAMTLISIADVCQGIQGGQELATGYRGDEYGNWLPATRGMGTGYQLHGGWAPFRQGTSSPRGR